MDQDEVQELIIKYRNGRCTEAEKALLEESLLHYNEQDIDLPPERIERQGKEIFQNLHVAKDNGAIIRIWAMISTIAALIALSIWLFAPLKTEVMLSTRGTEISPGGNRATLTLPDGRTIALSSSKTGVAIDANRIAYNDGTAIEAVAAKGEQVITTPKGGEYQLILADGTKVWLNAASSLSYSANLVDDRGIRQVRLLKGEAYFEVAKDKKHPFIVQSENQKVEVLGTHFNINTYDNREIKTTLLEGAVRVAALAVKGGPEVKLKPGQQSKLSANGLQVVPADIDLELAWKNGKTEFRDADLKTVMGMLERWYDIRVVYRDAPGDSRFSGSVSRHRNITEVLGIMESTNEVHFKIDGRRIEVLR